MPALDEEKRVIDTFLRKCNRYAEARIEGYEQELEGIDPAQRLELQEKITRWTTYIAFNTYTLDRLDGTELDEWLQADITDACECGG